LNRVYCLWNRSSLDIEIAIAIMKNRKTPGDDKIEVCLIKTVELIGMRGYIKL
jgi:hypothetical protein